MGKTNNTSKGSKKSCIFCGGAPICKEHIWPKWATKILPHGVGSNTRAKVWGFYSPELIASWQRQGDTKSITISAVCKDCNSGWMSQYESEVQQWITPMCFGLPVQLSSTTQKILGEYFIYKAMIADRSAMSNPSFTELETRIFHYDRRLPVGISVNLFNYIYDFDSIAQYNKESFVRLEGPSGPGVANYTLRFGKLLVQVLLFREADFVVSQQLGYSLNITPIHFAKLSYPPLFKLDYDKAWAVQHAYQAQLGSIDKP